MRQMTLAKQGTVTDPRFDLSKTSREIRSSVFDFFGGMARPWGPYFTVSPLFKQIDDPSLIARVDARAQAGLIGVLGPMPDLSAAMLDSIWSTDADVRSLYSIPARVAGDPFLTRELIHPSSSDPSLLKITTPLFAGQRFWLSGPDGSALQPTDVTGLGVLPSGEFLVAKPCSPKTPSPPSTLSWKIEEVQVMLKARGQDVPGPEIHHSCDLSVAQWWWRIGFALASDNSIVDALDKVNTKTGRFDMAPDADGPEGWEAQAAYVRAIFEAIANGYNALNIPWYIDPMARQLFRDWFAGHDSNEFDPSSDYNSGYWFSTREQCGEKRFVVLRPRISPNAEDLSNVGEMPARLSSMWKKLVSTDDLRTLEFVQKAGVLLWAGDATKDPYMASTAQNRGFATNMTMHGPSDALSGYWWDARAFARGTGVDPKSTLGPSESGYLDSDDSPWNLWWHRPVSRSFGDDWYAKILHAPPLQPRDHISDWRAGGFDHPGVGGVHVQGTVPLRWYVAYAREWLMMLCQDEPVSASLPSDMPTVRPDRRWSGFGSGSLPRRSVGEVLRQSLSNALQINLTWGTIYGGQEKLAKVLADKSAEFGRSQPNRTIGAVTGVVSAIGSSVGNALLPGVGSLIGVGVDTIGKILAAAIPDYVCDGYGRDDLGRPKPVFERSYLSGDPEKDLMPTHQVPVPFGFCRTIVKIPRVVMLADLPPPIVIAKDHQEKDSQERSIVKIPEDNSFPLSKVLVPTALAVLGVTAVYFMVRSRRQ
jgi:hypothetical protein